MRWVNFNWRPIISSKPHLPLRPLLLQACLLILLWQSTMSRELNTRPSPRIANLTTTKSTWGCGHFSQFHFKSQIKVSLFLALSQTFSFSPAPIFFLLWNPTPWNWRRDTSEAKSSPSLDRDHGDETSQRRKNRKQSSSAIFCDHFIFLVSNLLPGLLHSRRVVQIQFQWLTLTFQLFFVLPTHAVKKIRGA